MSAYVEEELKKIIAGRTIYAKNYHQNINFSSVGSYHNFIFRGAVKNFSKQSVVKMIRNVSANGIKAVIDYTLKNSIDGLAINEKGERVSSEQILKDWSKDFGINKNSKDAWHLVFSIKEPLDNERTLKALRESVEQIMASNFEGYKYSLVIHTHQNNPHAHVVMNKRNLETKKKIHFNSNSEIKEFFDDVRTNFAYALRERGLKYDNKHSLQKDLKQEFSKIKSSVNIELDEYNSKDRLNDFYLKLQERNNADFVATDTRIRVLKNECDELKKSNDELVSLYLQYLKKKNKRRFKLAREIKEQNKILKSKRKELLSEIKKIQRIEFNAKRLNDWQMSNYRDESKSVVLLENFVYNFHKLYPKNKNVSKADFENLQKVKKAIAELRCRKDYNAKKYLYDSLLVTRMLGSYESLFILGNKLEI
ncbi:MAG: relaxase/mobilization nuclease domain-containing protein, partial [Campylobacter sp.]|nr:relaxase/mobilization nuclease domain-containing protein [Campylobacter sp.]